MDRRPKELVRARTQFLCLLTSMFFPLTHGLLSIQAFFQGFDPLRLFPHQIDRRGHPSACLRIFFSAIGITFGAIQFRYVQDL